MASGTAYAWGELRNYQGELKGDGGDGCDDNPDHLLNTNLVYKLYKGAHVIMMIMTNMMIIKRVRVSYCPTDGNNQKKEIFDQHVSLLETSNLLRVRI